MLSSLSYPTGFGETDELFPIVFDYEPTEPMILCTASHPHSLFSSGFLSMKDPLFDTDIIGSSLNSPFLHDNNHHSSIVLHDNTTKTATSINPQQLFAPSEPKPDENKRAKKQIEIVAKIEPEIEVQKDESRIYVPLERTRAPIEIQKNSESFKLTLIQTIRKEYDARAAEVIELTKILTSCEQPRKMHKATTTSQTASPSRAGKRKGKCLKPSAAGSGNGLEIDRNNEGNEEDDDEDGPSDTDDTLSSASGSSNEDLFSENRAMQKKKVQVLRARSRALMKAAQLSVWLVLKYHDQHRDLNWTELINKFIGPVFDNKKNRRKSMRNIKQQFINVTKEVFHDISPNLWWKNDWDRCLRQSICSALDDLKDQQLTNMFTS